MNLPHLETTRRSPVKTSLALKIGGLLFVAFFVALGSALLPGVFLSTTRHDLEMVDVLGRQRMLSMQITSLSHSISEGAEVRAEDRLVLREAVDEFDDVLTSLRGKRELTRVHGTIPPEVRNIADNTHHRWASIGPALVMLLDPQTSPTALIEARDLVVKQSPALTEASNQMVLAYRARAEKQRQRLWLAELAAALFSLILVIGGFIFARGYIVTPLKRLELGARQLKAGDFGHRVEIDHHDELTTLAHAFNEMADEIERLVGALDKSREFAESVITHVPAGIVIHRDDEIIFANPEMSRLLGISDPRSTPFSEVFHPDSRERARAMTCLNDGPADMQTPIQAELRILTPQGGTPNQAPTREPDLTVEVISLRIDFGDDPAVLSLIRDISEQRMFMARMMQMDRVIAIGTLVAGVGHEINNPLTYVMGNLSFAMEHINRLNELSPLDPLASNALRDEIALLTSALEDAEEGTVRIRDIVAQLRGFARAETTPRKVTPVENAIESAVNMAFAEIRHRGRLVRDYHPVPPVVASESQLAQVFLNLLVNAAQAIPEGKVEENTITITLDIRDGYVAVAVRDTGSGIPPEIMNRLFDPFFTTKPMGDGTGLGLSICQQIVTAHGGLISVESTVGEGSTFEVLLPAATRDETSPTEARPLLNSTGPRQRVLVVDDEPRIGEVIKRVLARDHEVQVVTSPEEFLNRLRAGASYDIIFCDLMMPNMTGMDLYEVLQEEFPHITDRIVFITGGAFTPRTREFVQAHQHQVLLKPFKPETVRQRVQGAAHPYRAGAPET